jgi:hypothetical protein
MFHQHWCNADFQRAEICNGDFVHTDRKASLFRLPRADPQLGIQSGAKERKVCQVTELPARLNIPFLSFGGTPILRSGGIVFARVAQGPERPKLGNITNFRIFSIETFVQFAILHFPITYAIILLFPRKERKNQK